MDTQALSELIDSIVVKGWTVVLEGRCVCVEKADSPVCNRGGPPPFIGEYFVAYEALDAPTVWTRIFATIQFLQDHELREQFTVAGERPFEPHPIPPITGQQHDWFVEHESAVRGY